jgi:long-chain fatty acid transport protein
MAIRRIHVLSLAGAGVGLLAVGTMTANAGGFALREQSAFGQGSSYAGVAAGGSLSSMFWNPATMTQVPGLQSESVLSAVVPYSANTATGGALAAFGGTGNIANSALVPSSYYSWQVNSQLWLGLAINAPYGLTESFPDFWAGRDYGAGGSHLVTYNATPSIAYAINNWISVGVGVQIQYADATLTKSIGAFPTAQAAISGTGWGYGFTAGLTLTPMPGTTIGLGYRSALDQKIDGSLVAPGFVPASTVGSVTTTLNLPDSVSLGVRQKLSAEWTVMGTIEWTNWSRIGTAAVSQPSGAPALIGGAVVTIPFQYDDGWFYSLGAEYQWNPQLALRGGIGYEKSPITDQVRIPVLADDDRFWLSVGASYKYSEKISLDFAYSHIFVKDTQINVVAGNPSFVPGLPYVGTVDSHIDVISVALKYRWDDPVAAPKGKLVTK